MKEVFLFASLASNNHHFIYISHLVLVAIIGIIFAKLSTKSMQLVPKGCQNLAEAYLSSIIYMGKDMMGSEEEARKYLPLVATIGIIVFFSNVIGIFPGFESPTASLNLTLTLALCVFVYYHYEGIKANGFIKYFAHFMGPFKLLSPIMFPIEIISNVSRIVSLSFRLFGNIKGDDLFLLVIITLVPWVAPLVPFVVLAFMAVLQTFIFMILTYVYLAGAIHISKEH